MRGVALGACADRTAEGVQRVARTAAGSLRSSLVSTSIDTSQIEIGPEQLADWRAREPELQVIDVREPYEREAGRLADSRHIALVELTAQAATVERERPVVFYCRVGARSDMAAQAFRASGYEAYSLSGGLRRWADEGRPLEPQDGYVAEH
jgi:rhodanese-related sulfurtransferase